MIRNQWYVVLESQEVKAKPVGVTRMGEKLVFWRDGQGRVHCLFDKCCHRGAALSAGRCEGERQRHVVVRAPTCARARPHPGVPVWAGSRGCGPANKW